MSLPTPKYFLVDLDGVIADFMSQCNLYFPEYNTDFRLVDTVTNVVPKNKFWSRINGVETFWSTMKPTPWAGTLLKFLDQFRHPAYISFCTKPSEDPCSFSGKFKWIRKHYGNFYDFILTNNKSLISSPDHFLIDDYPRNIEEFRGRSYLWPYKKLIAGEVDIHKVLEEMLNG